MEQNRHDALQYFASPEAKLRPVMTSLNGDNSWLLSFPRPPAEQKAVGRAFYHVVFEPWLAGPTQLMASWFIHISLTSQPKIPTPQAIEGVIRQIEDAAAALMPARDDAQQQQISEGEYTGGIDAILLQFHYLDHVHPATLKQFDKSIPVIATPEAIAIVKPWGHFKTICPIHDLDPSQKSWRQSSLHPGEPAPSWLTPIRMPGHAELNFCTAIVWSHAVDGKDEEVHEVIFNSPHGTKLDEGPLQAFLDAEPKTEKLAMLHGLKESFTAGYMNTYGAKGGLAFYRRVGGTRYWVKSHHSKLAYTGVFMRIFVRDLGRTLDWALEEEKKEAGQEAVNPDKPNVVDVENGSCFILK